MEIYKFLASNFSLSGSNESRETEKSLSSPRKSERSQILHLESQITLNNESKVNTPVDVSIQKDENEKAAQASEQKSISIINESLIKLPKPSQAKKRTTKRCQTTVNIVPIVPKSQQSKNDKYFVKKNNHIIETSFEKLRVKRSTFSGEFITNLRKNQKPIQVRYFRSYNTKVLVIDEDMLAIEFIVLALNQYKNETKFDQSFYEYPNYSLAYQLEGQDDQQDTDDYCYRRPIQRTKSFGSADGKKSRKISEEIVDYDQKPISQAEISLSQDEVDDRIIQIDLQSAMHYYKSVDIVLIQDQDQLSIQLDLVKILHQQMPSHILILIEEPKSEGKFHIKIKPDQLIEDLFAELVKKTNSKYPKTDYFLCLKYPCVHFGTDPLNQKMPISKLPIHYLVLTSKFIIDPTRQTFITESLTLNQNKETVFSKSANKSYRFLQDEGKNYDSADKISNFYSYQEFLLVKYDHKFKNPVRLGIDYFDLYYVYVQDRQRNLTVSKLCKSIAKLLLQDAMTDKDYRRIPINKIIKLDMKADHYLRIVYEKSQNYRKELIFGIDLTQEKIKQELQQKILMTAFNKLDYLVALPLKYKQHL